MELCTFSHIYIVLTIRRFYKDDSEANNTYILTFFYALPKKACIYECIYIHLNIFIYVDIQVNIHSKFFIYIYIYT